MADLGQCEARKGNPYGVWRHRCENKAKVVRDGKHLCLVHDPVRKQEKQDAIWQRNAERAKRQGRLRREKIKRANAIEDAFEGISTEDIVAGKFVVVPNNNV